MPNDKHRYILETKRLILRQFDVCDTDFIYELMNSELYLKNIGDRNIKNKEDAERYLNNHIRSSYETNGFGLYAVQLQESPCLIGMTGLVIRDALPHPDIGFCFLPEHMGKNYALESALAVMDYARNNLQIKHILGVANPENDRSIRLLNKLGLRQQSVITLNDNDVILFSTDQGR